jgi:cytoskeleton protein RodZ
LLVLPNEPAPAPVAGSAEAASQVKALSELSPAAGRTHASEAGPLEAKAPLTLTSAPATTQPAVATASAGPATPGSAPSSEPAHIYGVSGDVPYRIALRAAAETWLEVKDGKTSIFRRLMQAGDEYRLPEKPGLVMRLGNARRIEVLVDGKPLPASAQPSQGHRTVVDLGASKLLAHAGTQ